jgi:hypothetical protein
VETVWNLPSRRTCRRCAATPGIALRASRIQTDIDTCYMLIATGG